MLMLSGKLRKGGLDERQARPLVDMDRADYHLSRAAFPDRQILVPSLFLGEPTSMHGGKHFPGTS